MTEPVSLRLDSTGGDLPIAVGAHLGLAIAVDALSAPRRDYLAFGGRGFTLGDGALDYGTERIVEAYYSYAALNHLTICADVQLIHNPCYNRARGPARFIGLRVHVEL